MNIFLRIVLFFLLLGMKISVFAQIHQVQILTYNIKMLPRILLREHHHPIKRARILPDLLLKDSIDVIVFQEAFDGKANRILRKKLKKAFPYQIGPANNQFFSFKTSSGVMIMSRFPMKKLGEVDFRTCEDADCMARKGGLLCEVALPTQQKIQVLGTHAEAGGSFEMKVGQFQQLNELLAKFYSPHIPQFSCGDFNVNKENLPLYDTLTHILGVKDGQPKGDLQYTSDHKLNNMAVYEPEHRRLIDYVFFKGEKILPIFEERRVMRYESHWHSRYSDLSDHFAVKLKIQFQQKQ